MFEVTFINACTCFSSPLRAHAEKIANFEILQGRILSGYVEGKILEVS